MTKKKESNLEIKATRVFEDNLKAFDDYRFIINQGGSRSSKTTSICQLVIVKCLSVPNYTVSIIRKTMPALRGSIMKDFFNLLNEYDLYSEKHHNKSINEYRFPNGSVVEFFSATDEQRLKGRTRKLAVLNEADELDFGEFTQINIRTEEKIIIDFNPSCDEEHWLWNLIKRPNSILIKSTYKDNPFLSKEQIDEIEGLINADENYYKIYALGEKPTPHTRVYTHYKLYSHPLDKNIPFVYGLDFGFNHPTVLVKVYHENNKLYVEEIIYQSGLTSSDLIKLMKELNIEKNVNIYCDSARPEIIEDLKRSGFKAVPANKSIKEGIDFIKSKELFININSTNTIKELKLYSYRTINDKITDEVIKLNDDAMDAMRYAAISFKNNIITYQIAKFRKY